MLPPVFKKSRIVFIRLSSERGRSLILLGNCKSTLMEGFSFGHSAFGAGVTVTIVRASKVGVKVGIVGRGVMDAVGVSVGMDVFVSVGSGEGVAVAF